MEKKRKKEDFMKDFSLNLATEIFSGKDSLDKLPEAIREYGEKVLLVLGQGSVKKWVFMMR